MAITKYKVNVNQNIFDIAVQNYGDVMGVIQILKDNETVSLTSNLVVGSELNIDSTKVMDKTAVSYIQNNNLILASGGNI